MATSEGGIKRTPLTAFSSIQRNGLAAIKLSEVRTCCWQNCAVRLLQFAYSRQSAAALGFGVCQTGARCLQPSSCQRCARAVEPEPESCSMYWYTAVECSCSRLCVSESAGCLQPSSCQRYACAASCRCLHYQSLAALLMLHSYVLACC
jgi:hypothetical protein